MTVFLSGLCEALRKLENPEHVGSTLLHEVARAFECQWGNYWQVQGNILRSLAYWSDPSILAKRLEDDVKSHTMASGAGTAAHVWRKGHAFWSHDLTLDMCLPRSLEAAQAGLTAGLWIPLKRHQNVFAILELLSRRLPRSIGKNRAAELDQIGVEAGKLVQPGSKRAL